MDSFKKLPLSGFGDAARIVIAVGVICTLVGCASPLPMTANLNEFLQFARHTNAYRANEPQIPFSEKTITISRAYQQLLGQYATTGVVHHKTEELLLLYDAINMLAFYTKSPEHVGVQREVFDELSHRGTAKQFHATRLFDTQVSARMFEEARTLHKAYPEASKELLPQVLVAADAQDGKPSAWILLQNDRGIIRRPVAIGKGWQLVIVSHPFCGFSRNAAAEIFADAALADRLKDHMLWVAPQDGNLSYDAFAKWNRMYPTAQHAIVHRAVEWPLPDFSATPTFYFLRDGVIQEQVIGWPREGEGKTKFVEALNRLTMSRPK